MSWQQATFVIAAAEVTALSEMLEGFLAQAITTENAGEDEFYEVAFPGTPDWQTVKLTALFTQEVNLREIVDFVKSHFQSEVPVSIEHLVDQDWERVWLESFTPIKVGEQLWVCPSWCEPIAPDERNIILDPGLAFGTGTHATTHLCLQWLAKQNLEGQTVLDYGAGSGLLAIASLFSGARHADAVDIDPLAVEASLNNADLNGVKTQLHAYLPEDLPESHRYEIVIANILAEVIIELRDTLLLHLQPGGSILLTGILNTQVQRVVDAFANRVKFEQYEQEQWCLLIGHS